MNKFVLTLLCGLSLMAGASPARADAREGIAAIVNDSIITLTDVHDRAQLYLSSNPGAPPPSPEQVKKVEGQTLDKLIDEQLQLQEAKKIGISVDEKQVNDGFSFIAKQNNLPPDEFRKRLKSSGINIDTLYSQIRAEIAWQGVVRREVRPNISISESEIDMTIDQLKQGDGKKQYHVAEIFLPVNSPSDDSDTRLKAQDLAEQINHGAPFSSVAKQFSQAPGAGLGGDLGWLDESQLDPALSHAITELHPGQISEPLRGEKGYYIVFLREERTSNGTLATPAAPGDAGPVVSLKQIIIPVSRKDPENVIKAKFARGVSLQKELKDCATMEKRMKEFRGPGTGTLGEGPEKALQPQLRAIVEKLAVNQLSPPIKAKEGWALIMVCSRTDPAGAAPTPDKPLDKDDTAARDSIADKLGLQRMDKMAEHYLRDLRAAAFIDRRL